MPWFKVDDDLAFHRKVVAAGNPAMGLWVRAGSWCAQQLTDGFVPDHMASLLGTPAQAAKLVAVGLWTRAEGGYSFHQWSENGRQPTSGSVREERAKTAKRQADWREKKRAEREAAGARNGVTPPLVTGDVTPPVTGAPTRPDPTRPSSPYGEEKEAAPQPPAPAGHGRGGGSRERATPADLAATAHSPQAHTLVSAWAADRGLLRPQQRELSKAVDELLRQGADPALVPAALDAAHDDPRWQIPAKSLRFAYEHVVRQQRPPGPYAAPPMNKSDARIAAFLAGGDPVQPPLLRAIGDS